MHFEFKNKKYRNKMFLISMKYDRKEVIVLFLGLLSQGYLREAKCHLAMGEIATAIIAYSKVLQLEPQNSTAKSEVSFSFLHLLAYIGR